MRNWFWVLPILLLIACSKDDNNSPTNTASILHYDGDNQSAPIVARGISYAAAKFSHDEIDRQGHQAAQLSAIDFHITQAPEALRLILFAWNQMDDSEPGAVIFESNIAQVSANNWNRYTLSPPIDIPDDGFWIALEVDAGDSDLAVVGCDRGPHHADGDIYGLFGNNLPGWTSYFAFTQRQVDINWNIRGIIE